MPRKRTRTPDARLEDIHRLHAALEPFIDLKHLRRAVAEQGNLYNALRTDDAPARLQGMLAALEALLTPREREQIDGPGDVAALLMVQMGALEQEELRVLLLDTKNHLQDTVTVYRGCVDGCTVRIGEIFREPVRRNTTRIILAHNHPSGDPTPSPEDVRLTRTIREAGRLLDIEVLDHLIIGHRRWISLQEKGMFPPLQGGPAPYQ